MRGGEEERGRGGGGEGERRRGTGEKNEMRGENWEKRFLVMRVLEIAAVGEGARWKRRAKRRIRERRRRGE